MNIYLIALTPLLLAFTGLCVVLPIGLHYADKEREERAEREANREVPVQYVFDTNYYSAAGVYPLLTTATDLSRLFFGQSGRQVAEDITEPKQSQVPRPPFSVVRGRRSALG